MSKRLVFCIATSWNRAEQILTNLTIAHVPAKDLSLCYDRETLATAPEGGVKELALAWPSADVGRFTALGPLLATLTGVTNGATDGSMAASLISLGVPLFEAHQFESRIKNGNILFALHVEGLGDVRRAKCILAETYGENICIIDPALAENVPSADHPHFQADPGEGLDPAA